MARWDRSEETSRHHLRRGPSSDVSKQSSSSPKGSRSGTNTANVDLSPDVVFVRDAPLSQQVVDYFTAWYGHKLIFDDVSWATGVITTVFPELKVADQIGKIASSSQGPDIVAALVLFALFHLSPDGLVITDLRDSSALHGFFGNGFLTGFVSMMKDFAGYMHPGLLNKGHLNAVMQLTLTEQSYCDLDDSILGYSTLCESLPTTSSFILFSLTAAESQGDLNMGLIGFHGSSPTSLAYYLGDWMPAQAKIGGLKVPVQ